MKAGTQFSKLKARDAQFADFSHLLDGELSSAITFSLTNFGMFAGTVNIAKAGAALDNAISLIVQICAEKQIGRADARRIVATMADSKAFGDWTISNSPSIPMRPPVFAIDAEFAVSAGTTTERPKPAGICFVDMGPETFFVGHQHNSIGPVWN